MRIHLSTMLLSSSAAAIEVISSGWPRTGTDTLKNALDTLGYKTYHMKEIMENGRTDHMRKWAALLDGGCKDKSGLRTLFSEYGYTAEDNCCHRLCDRGHPCDPGWRGGSPPI